MTITLTREEAQQVLDALSDCRADSEEMFYDYKQKYGEHYKPQRITFQQNVLDQATQAIETLRARLAQPEPERCKHGVWSADHCYQCEAQPEPPCKTGSQCIGGKCLQCVVDEPEPVAWMNHEGTGALCVAGGMDIPDWKHLFPTPLYVAPPQREWQGLTDEEVRNEAKNHVFDESFFNGAIWARGQIMGKNNE